MVVDDDGVTSFATSALADPLDGEPFDPLTPTLAYRELPSGDAARRTGGRASGCAASAPMLAAAQLVGVAQGALDVASAYALERHQFGAPIGSFQAVKHLLADMYVRVELARSATYAAAAVFDDDRAGDVADRGEHREAARRRGRHRQRADRGAGPRRHGFHVGDGSRTTSSSARGCSRRRFGTGDAHALALSAALESGVRAAVTTWT